LQAAGLHSEFEVQVVIFFAAVSIMLGHTVVGAYFTGPVGRFGNAISLCIYALTSKIYVHTVAFALT
jgi:hypothetical protein